MTSNRRTYRDPGELARVLGKYQDLKSPRDWSAEILMLLALAYNAAQRLKEEQGKTAMELVGRLLIIPAIERAFRETLYIRQAQDESSFSVSDWPVKISRTGQIEEKNKS